MSGPQGGEATPEPFDPARFLAGLVREAGEAKRPVSRAELRAKLAEAAPGADFETAMDQALAADPDISPLAGAGGETHYRLAGAVSAAYARILALKSSAVELIAETVRDNARIYPRPVALDLFESPPFDLAPDVIEDSLHAMADDPEFADITFTATTLGTIYLFSTRHLDRGYAEFLAERTDVGVVDNP